MNQLMKKNNKSQNKNQNNKMKKLFKAKIIFMAMLMLGGNMAFVSCSDDEGENLPTETTAASVYGEYNGNVTIAAISTNDTENSDEGTAVSATVENDTICIDSIPVRNMVMAVVSDESEADRIVKEMGKVSYKIGYKPTVNAAKDSVMLALDPKPLQLSFKTAPQEEGGDSVAVSMEVKMSSADGANYEGKTTNLKFVFSADEITVDNDGAQSALPDFNQTTFNFSMKKNGR